MAAHKILVIDDSRVIRNMVRDMLPPGNFEVIEAPDGIRGLEMIQKEKPWMILLDFLLPRMSGFEVYENLQKNSELRRIPLLLMSGRKEEVTSKISEPFEDKYFAFIEKPFESKELIAGIKKAIDLSKKLPPESVTATPTDSAGAAAVDAVVASRLEALEARARNIDELDKRIKLMEQQVAIQHKQIQQLVAFIKQKLK
ncbi:response regulator receiver protein [Thalassoporum mexicanum PCC 7367]|uniref:response regulator n=1 Tax=Thalassoporum mexicanum TaxID=3457544 RepID=UPI00029FC010|nr:response regulator [Pseudanabaena sp. PCC 7367]AFY69093.1 response regulator receiver protein [Pseudanabaena sp. PCC 7367]